MKKLIPLLLLLPLLCHAQVTNPTIVPVSSAPSGSCTQTLPIELLTPNGTLYSCQNGTWGAVSGGGSSISLTTTGNSNNATLTGSTLNIPVYGTKDSNGNELLLDAGPSGGIDSGAGITNTFLWGTGAGASMGTGSSIVVAATASSDSTTLDIANAAGIQQNMNVSGTGIASGTTISAIGTVPVVVSQTLTANVTSATITVSTTGTTSGVTQIVNVGSTSGIYPGMVPSGTNIGTNNFVTAVGTDTVTLHWRTEGAVSGTVTFSATEAASGTDGGTTVDLNVPGWVPVSGEAITGTGIPSSTTISSVGSVPITLSAATTASISGNVTFTYGATGGMVALGNDAAESSLTNSASVVIGQFALQACSGVNAGDESVNGVYIGPFVDYQNPCLSVPGSALVGDFEPIVIGNKGMDDAYQLSGTIALGNHNYGTGGDAGSVFVGDSVLSSTNWGISTGSIVGSTDSVIVGASQLIGGPVADNTNYTMQYDIFEAPLGVTCFYNSIGNIVIGAYIDNQSSCTSSNLFSGVNNVYIAPGASNRKWAPSWTGGNNNVVMIAAGNDSPNNLGGNLTTGSGNTILGPGAGESVENNIDDVVIGDNADAPGGSAVSIGRLAVADSNTIEINAGSTTYTNATAFTAQFFDLPVASLASFSVSGCGTAGSLTGSGLAGTFTAGATSCTPVITTGVTAPHGFVCDAHDWTTPADTLAQASATTTTATFGAATVGSGDTIAFTCSAY